MSEASSTEEMHCRGPTLPPAAGREEQNCVSQGTPGHLPARPVGLAAVWAGAREEATKKAAGTAC